jgi:hypothetical protein
MPPYPFTYLYALPLLLFAFTVRFFRVLSPFCSYDFSSHPYTSVNGPYTMDADARYCTGCMQKLPPPSFLKDPSATPTSRVYRTCMDCRAKRAQVRERALLQSLDPNVQPPKRIRYAKNDPPRAQQAPLPLQPPLPAPLTAPPSSSRLSYGSASSCASTTSPGSGPATARSTTRLHQYG